MFRSTSFFLATLLLHTAVGPAAAEIPVERIVSGLDSPVFVTAPPGDARLFVLEQDGVIQLIVDGAVNPIPFLDIRDRVRDAANEQGLLGMAFPPDHASSGVFYLYYTAEDLAGGSRLARYRVGSDPNVALRDEKILLEVAQPRVNHNGGTLAFGPDGMLFFGLGDSGGSNDPDEAAQDRLSLLGKILRLDVAFTDFEENLEIPASNPFFGDEDPGGPVPNLVRDEIWALGLRNPYRFSFDRETGDLYIADVGQNAFEEVNVELAPDAGSVSPLNPGGANYGWDLLEANACTDPGNPLCDDPGFRAPVHAYPHPDVPFCRASITGGVVYRGSRPELQGEYFFADFCADRIWSFPWLGREEIPGGDVSEWTGLLQPDAGSLVALTAIGEDAQGELLLLSREGSLFRVVPEPGASLLITSGLFALAVLARLR